MIPYYEIDRINIDEDFIFRHQVKQLNIKLLILFLQKMIIQMKMKVMVLKLC